MEELIKELRQEIKELKDNISDYEELLKYAKEERDEYKKALIEIVDIGRKLV